MIFAFKLALLDVWYLQFSEYLNTIFTKKKKKKNIGRQTLTLKHPTGVKYKK